jgi:CDP-diacylglycerol--serine O-phosphatidyltransferase
MIGVGMTNKYRYLIPNGITFASLTCGTISILLSATGNLQPAGILILVSYVLDLFDGALARRLKAGSEFGLQLDSLVDMVSLGTAPAVLVFTHLEAEGLNMSWVWPFAVLVPLAGAFRLARYNLLPPKETSDIDSVGLTISNGGAVLALAVLSDLAWPGELTPHFLYIPLLAIVSLLMVSKISFPSMKWVFSGRRRNALLIVLVGTSLLQLPFLDAWFVWTNAYLGISLARAGYRTLR